MIDSIEKVKEFIKNPDCENPYFKQDFTFEIKATTNKTYWKKDSHITRKNFIAINKSKYEEAGRKAFCGLQYEDILKKAFPYGCNGQEAIDYFVEHGEELEALGLI